MTKENSSGWIRLNNVNELTCLYHWVVPVYILFASISSDHTQINSVMRFAALIVIIICVNHIMLQHVVTMTVTV